MTNETEARIPLEDLLVFRMSWSRPIDVLLCVDARRVRVADLLAVEDEGDPVDGETHRHRGQHRVGQQD